MFLSVATYSALQGEHFLSGFETMTHDACNAMLIPTEQHRSTPFKPLHLQTITLLLYICSFITCMYCIESDTD